MFSQSSRLTPSRPSHLTVAHRGDNTIAVRGSFLDLASDRTESGNSEPRHFNHFQAALHQKKQSPLAGPIQAGLASSRHPSKTTARMGILHSFRRLAEHLVAIPY
jgi:hypothetical protein